MGFRETINASVQQGTLAGRPNAANVSDGTLYYVTDASSQAMYIASGGAWSVLAMGSTGIVDQSLTATDLAPDSVTSSEVAANAIGESELANASVGAGELGAGALQQFRVVQQVNGRLTQADGTSRTVLIAAGNGGSTYQVNGGVLGTGSANLFGLFHFQADYYRVQSGVGSVLCYILGTCSTAGVAPGCIIDLAMHKVSGASAGTLTVPVLSSSLVTVGFGATLAGDSIYAIEGEAHSEGPTSDEHFVVTAKPRTAIAAGAVVIINATVVARQSSV